MYTLGIAAEYPFDLLVVDDSSVLITCHIIQRFVAEDIEVVKKHPLNQQLYEDVARLLWLANLGERTENKPERKPGQTIP